MRNFFIISLFLLPSLAWSAGCEVDGISDSPQSMSCYIHNGKLIGKLDLACDDGKYYLKWKGQKFEVNTAYHEDVEEGSSPLVFVTDRMTLTTVSYKVYSTAELVLDDKTHSGLCFSYK
jgi:hypothetical protein